MDLPEPLKLVFRSLDLIIAWRGKPSNIRADNELINTRVMEWVAKYQIHIQHIQQGKPQQNAYGESINEVHEFATQSIYK